MVSDHYRYLEVHRSSPGSFSKCSFLTHEEYYNSSNNACSAGEAVAASRFRSNVPFLLVDQDLLKQI